MKKLVVIGKGDALDRISTAWIDAMGKKEVIALSINYGPGFIWDQSLLKKYKPAQYAVFVGLGNQLLNGPRQKIMRDVKKLGYKLPTFIAKTASISSTAKIGEGGFIGEGAVVGAKASILPNSYIGPCSVIGLEIKVGHSCWLGASVVLDDYAQIGDNTTLTANTHVYYAHKVGKMSEINKALDITEDIPDYSFYDPLFETHARVYGSLQR